MALTKVPSNLDATVATTQSASDNSTNVATTAYVTTAIANLSDSAPAALNTLNEIAAALGDDANYAATTTAAIAAKLPLAGGTLTGALTVTGDANPALEISRGSANTTNVNLKYNTTLTGQLSAANAEFQISAAGSSTPMEFFTNGSERMRIDSSGNLLVGQQTASSGTVGTSLRADGRTFFCADGNYAAHFNRNTSNGDIAHFAKNDNIVGSIGVVSDDRMYFTTADGLGLQFDKDNNRIIPCDAAGAYNNNVELGDSSLEFTNLWLSNNAYIGNAVGIGTNNPTEKLHIGGTAPGDSIIRQDATSSGTNWEIGERVAGKYQFWEDDGDNVRLTIMSTGNVGIGTASPSDKLEVSGTGGTRLKVTNTDTNWAGLDLQAGGNQANYLFFRDESAERSRIMATDGGEISFLTGASPVQRLKISTNDIVMGTGTVNEAAKIISSGGTTVIRAADSNHSIILRGTQDASGNITGNVNTMGFYEYGGYEFYTKQGNSRVKSLDMPSGGKVNINTSTPRSKYFDVNGVAEISESFNINNGTQYDFDYTVPDTTGTGNSYFIIAGYNHYYNTDYGAHKVGVFSCRATSFATMINIGDQSSTGGGAWQFSKPTATTLRIRKTAGTYVGSGHGFIKVFFRDY